MVVSPKRNAVLQQNLRNTGLKPMQCYLVSDLNVVVGIVHNLLQPGKHRLSTFP
jgi:hypothetical protein